MQQVFKLVTNSNTEIHQLGVINDKSLPTFSMVISDRCLTPEGSQLVYSVQLKVTEHLQKVMQSNHPEDSNLFARAMVFLADMRSLTLSFGICNELIL